MVHVIIMSSSKIQWDDPPSASHSDGKPLGFQVARAHVPLHRPAAATQGAQNRPGPVGHGVYHHWRIIGRFDGRFDGTLLARLVGDFRGIMGILWV